jgi:MFS family permease
MSRYANESQVKDTAAAAGMYRWYVVGVLFFAYTLSYVDRTILTLLITPIRASLGISDTQVSLLHGLAFALFYTILGIPIARIADSRNRVYVISAGVAVWSGMTMLCGVAKTLPQLFLARAGVGVGEGALAPSAYSILSDYFAGAGLTRALSVYASAIYFGSGLALIVGGALVEVLPALTIGGVRFQPWQLLLMLVGLPGLGVAALFLSTVREPKRTGLAQGATAGLPVKQVLLILRSQGVVHVFLMSGFAVLALVWYGAISWIPTYFTRSFGWPSSVVGLRFGLMMILCGMPGIILGGNLGSWLKARGRTDANPLVGLIAALAVFATGAAAPLQTDSRAALAAFAVFVFAGSMPWGAFAAAFLQITPNQMRAQVTAIYFFVITLVGLGLGPLAIALVTDRVFHDDQSLKYSLSVLSGIFGPVSAILLWRTLRPFRRALNATN